MILKHFTKNNENHKNPFPSRLLCFGQAEVLTPDLPLHPKKALAFIENICQQEKPCVLVGNSNGAFLAQIAASRLGLPALLGNPYLVVP